MQSKEQLTSKGSCSCKLREQKGDARTTKLNPPSAETPQSACYFVALGAWRSKIFPKMSEASPWLRKEVNERCRVWVQMKDGEIEHYRFGGKICKSGGFYVYFYLDLAVFLCFSDE